MTQEHNLNSDGPIKPARVGHEGSSHLEGVSREGLSHRKEGIDRENYCLSHIFATLFCHKLSDLQHMNV